MPNSFTPPHLRLRVLQTLVALCGLIPVSAGAAGILLGLAMIGAAGPPGADSHFRYLSGLLLGIGLAYWWTIPDITRRTAAFRLLTALVVLGGLARLSDTLADGMPSAPVVGALAMELLAAPLLCWLQARVAVSFETKVE